MAEQKKSPAKSDKAKATDKVKTTLSLPREMAEEVQAVAARSGIGWTQMIVVLVRQALDAQNRQ